MVLTRAALEKLHKEELIWLFVENNDKLNSNMTNLTNQLAEVNKTLERMESQKFWKQQTTPSKNALAAWKNNVGKTKQYSWCECVEIVEISDSTRKVWELIEKVTGINVNQDCLELCHPLPPLPSDKKNKIIIIIIFKFSRQKDDEKILRNNKKTTRTLSLEV